MKNLPLKDQADLDQVIVMLRGMGRTECREFLEECIQALIAGLRATRPEITKDECIAEVRAGFAILEDRAKHVASLLGRGYGGSA